MGHPAHDRRAVTGSETTPASQADTVTVRNGDVAAPACRGPL